ncbi:MAG: cell division protein ZapA [Spirochaetales bacterium]|nr:cell division protein ZapA [Spirochaetales bacterium]
MEKRAFQVQLLGTSFIVQTDEDADYFTRLLDYVSKKTDEIESAVRVKDPLKTAILTCLTIADELHKGFVMDQDLHEAEKITLSLLEKIDRSLDSR